MSWDEATLNGKEIKPVALALYLSENKVNWLVGQSVRQSGSHLVENPTKKIIILKFLVEGLGLM